MRESPKIFQFGPWALSARGSCSARFPAPSKAGGPGRAGISSPEAGRGVKAARLRGSTSDVGRQGEELAAEFLQRRRYRILAKNVRTSCGEIDLIARDRDTLVFVEVRTRAKPWHGHPFESITPQKRKSLIRAALIVMSERHWDNKKARFDVVAVLPQDDGTVDLELLPNAFEVEQERY